MVTTQLPSKLASKPINREFMKDLEVLENRVYPLQGAYGERQVRDSRLSTFVGAGIPQGNTVCYYEHLTTVRHRPSGTFYIVFRETRDAQLMRQSDPVKYPRWLMEHAVKDDERAIYIHMAKPNAQALLKRGVSTIADWLDEIPNDLTFNSIAKFLLESGLWTEKMYGSFA